MKVIQPPFYTSKRVTEEEFNKFFEDYKQENYREITGQSNILRLIYTSVGSSLLGYVSEKKTGEVCYYLSEVVKDRKE